MFGMDQLGSQNKRNVMNKFLKPAIIIILGTLVGCVQPQHRLDFDLNRKALLSCDENIKIKHLRIMEKDGEGIGYEILLEQGEMGSNIIYLDTENAGYYCNSDYPLKFYPGKEYIVSSILSHSSLEMSLFTNNEGKIVSVTNPMGCIR
jgi:hypothetical protein